MLSERGKQIRRDTLKLARENGGYHFGGCFSATEIISSLYDSVMGKEDVFLLSKGHSCWPLYVILKERGLSPRLQSHPHRDPANGIAWTSGSLGHGFPAAIGIALAKILQKKEGRVFVLLGDGECQEGTTWESLLLAARLQLSNLTVIVDNNHIQGSDYTEAILPIIDPVISVARTAGWAFTMAMRGHEESCLVAAFQKTFSDPHLIFVQTEKGKGVSFMEDLPEWHAKWPSDEQYKAALEELK